MQGGGSGSHTLNDTMNEFEASVKFINSDLIGEV